MTYKKAVTLVALVSGLMMVNPSFAADCSGVSAYPNWTASNWAGNYDHANAGDLMQHNNRLYKANWWTQALPGSNSSWSDLGQCSDPTNPVKGAFETHGKLAVCDTNLCNQANQPVQLKGMSSHGLQWYGLNKCLTNQSLEVLAKEWRSDILRLSLYVQEGGYESDPVGFTKQMNQLIEMASQKGMYVLVDWHQLSPGDPNFNLALAKQFFTDVVTANKHRDNVIYDIANEPNNVSWAKVREYAVEMIPHIRAIDPDSVILVGTHGWASFGVSDGGSPQEIIDNPIPFDNIMYTFHFYAASHLGEYRQALELLSSKLPVFVTEFGTQTYSGDGQNDFASATQYMEILNRKKISWTNWNYSDDMRSGAVWKQGTCQSGQFVDNNLKAAGKWVKQQMLQGR